MKNWTHPWVTREDALKRISERSRFIPRSKTIPVREALFCVTAEDILAINTLPNCPASSRDGIAVHFGDFAGGMPDTASWQEGRNFVYCNTGIGIPEGYDTVILRFLSHKSAPATF